MGWTEATEARASEVQERFQFSRDAQSAWTILAAEGPAVLACIADLCGVEPSTNKTTMVTRLVADRHGATEAGTERIARTLGAGLPIFS